MKSYKYEVRRILAGQEILSTTLITRDAREREAVEGKEIVGQSNPENPRHSGP
jgi:hypothetical protein